MFEFYDTFSVMIFDFTILILDVKNYWSVI